MTERSCAYCFKSHAHRYFSNYVMHILDEADTIPIFCDKKCMISWAAIKKNMSLKEVEQDFSNFGRCYK
jgi:hypothetical protein